MAKKAALDKDAVKKYLFWACTSIGLVAAMLCGWLAIGSIATEMEQQKKSLEDQKNAAQQLRGQASNHPNAGTIESIKEETQKLAENVFTAWNTMAVEQQRRNRWDGLADRAIREIESKTFLDPLEGTTLDNYLNFARDEMNKLLEKNFARPGEPEVRLRRVQQYRILPDGREEPLERIILTESRGTLGRGRGGGDEFGGSTRGRAAVSTPRVPVDGSQVVTKGVVIWSTPELDVTMKDWQQRPLAYEVWLTQEDLWVYQALLWVVAESNKNSREQLIRPPMPSAPGGGMSAAQGGLLNLRGSVVMEIIDMAIGRSAAAELEKQSTRRIGFGGSSADFSESSDSSSMSFSDGSGMSMDPESLKQAALARRYVDAEGTPLSTFEMSGQYRRMPVYLQFRVDQRRISDVLVSCANCPMPIDVLWVTINPDATESFDFVSSATMSGSGGEFSDSSDSSFGGSSRPTRTRGNDLSSGGRTGSGRTNVPGGVDFGPDAVIIEIYGCINIFAPPDIEKLNGGS